MGKFDWEENMAVSTIERYTMYLLDLRMGCMDFWAREEHKITEEDDDFYKMNQARINRMVDYKYADIWSEE